MKNSSKTKAELIKELELSRKMVVALQKSANHESDIASQYLDIAGVIFVAINTDGEVTLINKKGCDVLGYDEQDIIGKNWFESFVPENIREVIIPISKKLLSGEIEPVEYFENIILTSSGEERIIAWHNTILKDKAGNIKGHLSSGEDITDRKRAEEEIKASLKEKDVLLKEIHHRVKNNLQVVSSILSIQSGYIEDKALKGIFQESQDRIKSMALVHEQLYHSEDLSSISSAIYLNSLLDNICHSYAHSCNSIKLKTDIEDINIDVDCAMLLGLLLNELCTNTIKYAFADKSNGELKVEFKLSENDTFRLIVIDNGVGLPEGFDIDKAESMGFLLIKSMVSQLEGTMEIGDGPGMKFSLTFPM